MRAVAACILNLGSRRKWVVNITPQLPCPRASLDVLKRKRPLPPAGTWAPTCQAHTLITVPTSRIWRILFFYEIQQTSFNQTSRNLEILIIRHLRVIPSLEVLLFTSQKLCDRHWQISGTHSKRPPRLTNYINHCGIFWSLVSYTISFFGFEDCKNTVHYPDGPEPADGDFQIEYYSDQLYSPCVGAVTKQLLVRSYVSVGTTW